MQYMAASLVWGVVCWIVLHARAEIRRFFDRRRVTPASKRSCRLVPPRLNLDVDVYQRNRGRGDPGDTRSLRQCARAHSLQLLVHLAGEAADRLVVEPLGNGALFGFLQALDGALLLLQVTGILNI